MNRESQNFHIMIKQGITWYNLETETVQTYRYFILDMVCLLQSECNFLHGFFRCRLLVEMVDVEVENYLNTGDAYF